MDSMWKEKLNMTCRHLVEHLLRQSWLRIKQASGEQNYHMTQEFHSWVHIHASPTKKKKKPKHSINWKRYTNPNVHSSIVCNCHPMEVPYVSINRWMDNEDVVYKYNGILLNHKKKEILPFATTCGLRRHYNKWSKSNRERQILYDLIHGI